MGCFVVAEFLLTSTSRSPSAIAEPLVNFGGPIHISGMAGASPLKLCTKGDYIKSGQRDDKLSLKGAWFCSCDPFFVCTAVELECILLATRRGAISKCAQYAYPFTWFLGLTPFTIPNNISGQLFFSRIHVYYKRADRYTDRQTVSLNDRGIRPIRTSRLRYRATSLAHVRV